jgi:hypothetical protein
MIDGAIGAECRAGQPAAMCVMPCVVRSVLVLRGAYEQRAGSQCRAGGAGQCTAG